MWPLPARLQFALQGLNLAMIIFSALMIWKTLMVVTHSESPVVVVLRCVLDARPPRVRCRWLGCLRRCSRTRVCYHPQREHEASVPAWRHFVPEQPAG